MSYNELRKSRYLIHVTDWAELWVKKQLGRETLLFTIQVLGYRLGIDVGLIFVGLRSLALSLEASEAVLLMLAIVRKATDSLGLRGLTSFTRPHLDKATSIGAGLNEELTALLGGPQNRYYLSVHTKVNLSPTSHYCRSYLHSHINSLYPFPPGASTPLEAACAYVSNMPVKD